MSKRGHIQQHLRKLGEIGDIMRAMKNISLMETYKLNRFLEYQHRVVSGIEAAVNDFARHHAPSEPVPPDAGIVLAIGSERGLCGDFNDAVAAAVRLYLEDSSGAPPKVMLVGSRLAAKLDGDRHIFPAIEGASVVEEVQPVLSLVMKKLTEMHVEATGQQPLCLTVFSHQEGEDDVTAQVVSPVPAQAHETRPEPYPPMLLLPAQAFHHELVKHYLWAQMHYLFYSSLMAENRFRLQHMERAIQRMEEKSGELQRKQNIIRQEEITEEIEVIMLNADMTRARRKE